AGIAMPTGTTAAPTPTTTASTPTRAVARPNSSKPHRAIRIKPSTGNTTVNRRRRGSTAENNPSRLYTAENACCPDPITAGYRTGFCRQHASGAVTYRNAHPRLLRATPPMRARSRTTPVRRQQFVDRPSFRVRTAPLLRSRLPRRLLGLLPLRLRVGLVGVPRRIRGPPGARVGVAWARGL